MFSAGHLLQVVGSASARADDGDVEFAVEIAPRRMAGAASVAPAAARNVRRVIWRRVMAVLSQRFEEGSSCWVQVYRWPEEGCNDFLRLVTARDGP